MNRVRTTSINILSILGLVIFMNLISFSSVANQSRCQGLKSIKRTVEINSMVSKLNIGDTILLKIKDRKNNFRFVAGDYVVSKNNKVTLQSMSGKEIIGYNTIEAIYNLTSPDPNIFYSVTFTERDYTTREDHLFSIIAKLKTDSDPEKMAPLVGLEDLLTNKKYLYVIFDVQLKSIQEFKIDSTITVDYLYFPLDIYDPQYGKTKASTGKFKGIFNSHIVIELKNGDYLRIGHPQSITVQ